MKLILRITPGGSAELVRNGTVEWCSSDDESFRDEFADDLLTEEDLGDIIDYLEEEDYLTEQEAATLDCEEESLDGDEIEDEDEDEDEDYFDDNDP